MNHCISATSLLIFLAAEVDATVGIYPMTFIPTQLPSRHMHLSSSPDNDVVETFPETRILEVEQKFAISPIGDASSNNVAPSATSTGIVQKLEHLGFSIVKEKKFMDWYFDVDQPHWTLSTNNHFLRFRQPHQPSGESTELGSKVNGYSNDVGAWQLKKGIETGAGATTVYQEIEGDEAIDVSLSLIQEQIDADAISELKGLDLDHLDGYDVPSISHDTYAEVASKLIPFARIETMRTSWRWGPSSNQDIGRDDVSGTFKDLTVDLDGTDFGYMVGEVEAIVHNEDEVQDAKDSIQELIRNITSNEDDTKKEDAKGKLETYMIANRKDHYDACIRAGSMQ